MIQSENEDLLNYWNKVRKGRSAPKRIEISPSAISSILPVTFILEVINQEDLQFRLAGTKMCEIFDKEFRGQNFVNCWPMTERKTIIRHLSQLINEATVVTINCNAISKNNHIGEFEMIFLPLTHSGTQIDRILGSIIPKQNYPWAGLTKLEFNKITEVQVNHLLNDKMPEITHDISPKLSFLSYKRLVEGKHCKLRVFEGGKTD